MLKGALWYKRKSYLYHEQNVRMWACGTKANRIGVADQTLEGGFVAKTSSLVLRPSLCALQCPSP